MPTNKPNPGRTPGRALRILVADDDRDAVVTLSTLLQHEGHQVVEVYRADAVLGLVQRYQPDAVLLDIGMPGLTGFEVARQLRETLRNACPLLIAITAWHQEKARELGRLSGFNHYLTKPYSPDELLALLGSLAVSGRGVKDF
jgi:two-component system OmpR family response regulator